MVTTRGISYEALEYDDGWRAIRWEDQPADPADAPYDIPIPRPTWLGTFDSEARAREACREDARHQGLVCDFGELRATVCPQEGGAW